MSQDFCVLYIGGAGRSGTTLLELMLGEQEGVFAAGELTYLWRRGLVDNQLCGCSQAFRACELWNDILDHFRAHFGDFDAAAIADARDLVCSLARFPMLLSSSLRSGVFGESLELFTSAQRQLYRSIHAVTGAEFITDSTKYPPEAWMLGRMDIPSLIIHTVRDSRGVSYSWTKKKERPEIHWKTELMPRYPIVQTAGAWSVFNGFFEMMDTVGQPTVQVRYEDFVRRPREVIGEIMREAGSAHPLRHIGETSVELGDNHTASGNPLRFKRGEIELRLDDAWRTKLTGGKRLAVTALTLPFLEHYGYEI